MLIYGKQAVIEALESGQVQQVLIANGIQEGTLQQFKKLAKKHNVPLDLVARIDLDRTFKHTRHQGIAAELPDITYTDPEAPFKLAKQRGEDPLIILLDQITDQHNYGAIIRSAEVLGAHAVVTQERRSASLTAIAVKTSAGASNHLPLIQVKNLARYMDELKERGLWIYGSSGDVEIYPEQLDWQRPLALVIGSEGSGMRRLIRDKCDALVAIPMKGRVASLNASVAAGILIYSAVEGRLRKT